MFLSACGVSRYAHNSVTDRKLNAQSGERRISEAELRQKYARMLEVAPKKIKNASLYYFIDEWWGTRYKYGGSTLDGVDCSGFTTNLYLRVYDRKIARQSGAQYQQSRPVRRKKKLREGNLVFFSASRSRDITHVGVYLRNGYFVHASTGKGVSIGRLSDRYWEPLYVRGGRINN
jgi:lipoprotein Spr